ncbi:MAG: hypothetical protein ACI8UD_003464, partial [Planctomycetota bacterium]
GALATSHTGYFSHWLLLRPGHCSLAAKVH